jgi:hypothetical protein
MLGAHSGMIMREYFHKDFDNYLPLFKEHAIYFAELMKVLDDEFISMGLPPVGRTRELFKMASDLIYPVDESYREKFAPGVESDHMFTSFIGRDEIISSMRTLLQEELARYLESSNGDK